MTPEQAVRVRVQQAMVSADHRWAMQRRANPLPADRIDVLSRAVASDAVPDLTLQVANARGCLARLVEAITGTWRPTVAAGEQKADALRQLRQIEAFLLSLQVDQEVA